MEALQKIPLPTVDRPFGIELWPIFDAAWEKVLGYPATEFKFVAGETPFSTFAASVAVITTYYAIIFGGKKFMEDKAPLKLNALFQLHNVFLTFLSGALLVLFIEQLSPILIRHGIFYGICNTKSWTQKMVVLYYLNYLTKYFELLDTVFLFLKKKPLTFLHCYHHGATALLCYTQLVGSTSVSWVPITINLLVHVVMYWYYFLSARGIRVWWKEWITRLQIAQFIIDLGFVYFASYNYFTSAYFQDMPRYGDCAGEEFAAFAGCGILSSYLLLFISFYLATYKKHGKKAARRSLSTSKISLDPKFSDEAVASLSKNGQPGTHLEASNGKATGASTPNGRASRSRGSSPGGPVTRSRKV